ncbi:hypothetical protein B0H10DRAFT_2227856 [Mycena sp. CBHHK59/15]|nr:hypothetical protein B0H10DRAFT_2227856 [Mycena sp. CBHHK59/15]
MNPPDDFADPPHKQFMVARKIFPLDDRDWSDLSAPREGKDLSLVLRRIERIRRLPPHLSGFFDAYSIIIEPFISSTPPTSAPMWGPIVFALQLFIGSEWPLLTSSQPHTSLALDTILELFDDISDHLSRLVVPHRALFEDEPVKLALPLIYGDIIKICLQIIATTQPRWRLVLRMNDRPCLELPTPAPNSLSVQCRWISFLKSSVFYASLGVSLGGVSVLHLLRPPVISALAASLFCFDVPTFGCRRSRTAIQGTKSFVVLDIARSTHLLNRSSLTFLYTYTVRFDAVNTVLAGLPLLCRVDLMHSPCPLVPPLGVFPRHVRHFSFTPKPKVVPPAVVQDPLVFDPADEEEVSTVSTALHSILRQLKGTLETLDVPIWCFPLKRLRGIPWTRLRILSLRGYLPIDRRPTSAILGLFPHLESLEMEVVRTDPSLIERPQYLWVNSEEATFPSQLKHLSLIDVDPTDPIFSHLPADLDSLSIIDTRFRKYGRNFVDPGYDRNYRTWPTHTEIASILARLDLHFQRERFLLPAPEDFADALSPIRHTFSTLCIEQPHWNGLPAYSSSHRQSKARQKQWFDFLDGWLTALSQHMTALRRGSFGFNPVGQRNFDRWQSFLLRTPSGRSLGDSTPPGFTQWHINELTDYDKNFAEGDQDRYFYNEPVENPHLIRYSAWRDC